ncbi:MAG: hypothetical protein JWP89_5597 [Schlesneria sp.]|nr:hypothetical protein [Schlesneria sp.]
MRYLLLITAAMIGVCVFVSRPSGGLPDRRLLQHAAAAFTTDAERIQSENVTREEAVQMLRYHAMYFSVQAQCPH